MVELNSQLDLAKQQLAKRCSVGSVRTLTERCNDLENKIQLSHQRLLETSGAGCLTHLQTRLDVTIEERDRALKREQELLD